MWINNSVCIVLIFAAVVISSCGEVKVPPSEVEPDTLIVSAPAEVSVEPSVTFQWEGSHLVNEFSYRYTPGQDEWSTWSTDTSKTLDCLDQGDYVFEVKGRYGPDEEDESPAQMTFTIDIPGPGMLISPFRQKAVPGQEFEIHVVADDVVDLMLAHLILVFDPSQLQALDAAPGEALQSADPPVFYEEIDNTRGVVDLSISTITIKSAADATASISGLGRIAIITFKALSAGESSVAFHSASEFRNSINSPIGVANMIGSVIEIAE